MYDEITKIISGGSYELADLLHRIDVLYADARLTEDERAQLAEAARERADPTAAYAPLEQRVAALEAWRTEAEARMAALEGEPEEPGPADEYPAWHKPTCAEDAYYTGMGMTYTDGRRYVCVAPDGYGVTYGPDVLPGMWRAVGDDGGEGGDA